MSDTQPITLIKNEYVALPVAQSFLYTNTSSSKPQLVAVAAAKPAPDFNGHILSKHASLNALVPGAQHWILAYESGVFGAFTSGDA